jgi:hypothetical protein
MTKKIAALYAGSRKVIGGWSISSEAGNDEARVQRQHNF